MRNVCGKWYERKCYSYLNFAIIILVLESYVMELNCQFEQYNPQLQNIQMQNLQNVDNFEKELCRERRHRLDWQSIMQPCVGRTEFGRNLLPGGLRTNSQMSRLNNMDIQKTGEYSKLTIQTVDQFGTLKTIGGDTWRILITGPASMQPFVYDMNNGQYEIPFLTMEPGHYKADIFLQGSLCSQFFDPPNNWFKKGDYNGHFQEAHMYKNRPGWPYMLRGREWERLGGNFTIIEFQVLPGDSTRFFGTFHVASHPPENPKSKLAIQ